MRRSVLIAVALLALLAPTAGARIAYQSAKNVPYTGQSVLYAANDNGTGAVMIGAMDGYLPRISPDGAKVAWLRENAARGAALAMTVVPATEEEATPDVALGLRCVDMAWSPDSTRIACVTAGRAPSAQVDSARGLTIVDVATKATTTLVAPSRGQVQGVAWSPDGLRVAFGWARFAKGDYAPGRLELIGVDGGGRSVAAPVGAFPIWSAAHGIAYAVEKRLVCTGDTFADLQPSYRMAILDPATGASRVATDWHLACALGLLPFGFLPDGRVVATLLDAANQRYPVGIQTAIVDPATRRTTPIRFPDGGRPYGISADGTRLLIGMDFAEIGNPSLRSVDLRGRDARVIVRNAISASTAATWVP